MIDRIYDTLIDEEELRICDETTQKIFDELEPRPYSSREVHPRDGRLPRTQRRPKCADSIIYEAYKNDVPIFVPRLQRLLGRLRHRRPPARPRRSARKSASTAARIFTS